MEYLLAIKKNEVLIYSTMWMNLEDIISERSQNTKGYILYDFTCVKYPEDTNTFRKKFSGSHGLGVKGNEGDCLTDTQFPSWVMKLLWNNSGDGCKTSHMY